MYTAAGGYESDNGSERTVKRRHPNSEVSGASCLQVAGTLINNVAAAAATATGGCLGGLPLLPLLTTCSVLVRNKRVVGTS